VENIEFWVDFVIGNSSKLWKLGLERKISWALNVFTLPNLENFNSKNVGKKKCSHLGQQCRATLRKMKTLWIYQNVHNIMFILMCPNIYKDHQKLESSLTCLSFFNFKRVGPNLIEYTHTLICMKCIWFKIGLSSS
jgi:hypothetical protein